jgi:hypothetical protein
VEWLERRRLLTAFTVNSAGDDPDGNRGDGLADTGPPGMPSGITTLQAAIDEANFDSEPITLSFVGGLTINYGGEFTVAVTVDGAGARIAAGRDKRFGTRDDKITRPTQAIDIPANFSITLAPSNTLNLTQVFELQVPSGALVESFGPPIDGNRDGQPGGDLIVTVKKKTVTIQ